MAIETMINWKLGNGFTAYISPIGQIAVEEELENETFGSEESAVYILQTICLMFADIYDKNGRLVLDY